MRRLPPPLSVTRPPPSSTTSPWSLRTLAVAFIAMVTGAGPQSKVITRPAATAVTTAADVQLAGVPLPTTRSGLPVSAALASAGTEAAPSGLPGLGSTDGPFLETKEALGGFYVLEAADLDEAIALAGCCRRWP
jgi:hypothetical protein